MRKILHVFGVISFALLGLLVCGQTAVHGQSVIVVVDALGTIGLSEVNGSAEQFKFQENREIGKRCRKFYSLAGTEYDGKRLLAGGSKGNQLVVCEIDKDSISKPLVFFKAHKSDVRVVAFSRDKRYLATGSKDKTIKLWDMKTLPKEPMKAVTMVQKLKLVRTLKGHGGSVFSISFLPGGNRMISAGADGKAILWDLDKGTIIWEIEPHFYAVNQAEISPDGKLFATVSSDGYLKLWDFESLKNVGSVRAHDIGAYSVDFNPKNGEIATGGADGKINIWTYNGEIILSDSYKIKAPVNHVEYTPDSKKLIGATAAGDVIMWDRETGDKTQTKWGKGGIKTFCLF